MVVVGEINNNQDPQETSSLLFLISTLPLIYPFPFPGPSNGPLLLPEAQRPHSST